MSDGNIDLQDFDQPEHERNAGSRPDDSKAALLVLIGCSIFQLPTWGFAMSYGVLQEQYTSHPQFKSSPSSIGVIGTTLNGVLYMSLPILSTLFVDRLSQWRRTATILGVLISSASLVISSYSTAVWHLILTQGILCGLGSALAYSPTTLYLDDWFIKRKSFAYSVTLSAKNVIGSGTPFLTPALLGSLGLQNTLRVWGVITFVSGIVAMPMMQSRTNQQREIHARPTQKTPWKFLTHPTFYIFHIANIIFSSGYGLPQTYLPTYARQVLHLSSAEGALMLALFNFPGIFSCIGFGILGDGIPLLGRHSPSPFTITFFSAIPAALAAFFLWGLAAQSEIVGLALFSAIYGFFASAYSSTWGGALKEIQREAAAHNEAVDTGVVYGLLNGGRGIGYVVGGYAGVELLKDGALPHSSKWGYGTEYGSLILYTGVSAVLGGWSIFWNFA